MKKKCVYNHRKEGNKNPGMYLKNLAPKEKDREKKLKT